MLLLLMHNQLPFLLSCGLHGTIKALGQHGITDLLDCTGYELVR